MTPPAAPGRCILHGRPNMLSELRALLSFVAVATAATALLLLGWRAVVTILGRRR